MRLRDLVRLLPLGALAAAGCPASDSAGHDRAPPLDDGADAPGGASTAPTGSHATCGAAACAGGSCGGG